MLCKYCGKEVEQVSGKKQREYCSDSHRQMAYAKRRKNEKPAANIDARSTELEALRIQVAEQAQEIDDQAATIARLRLQVDVERRFLQDDKPRSFKAFLKKKPATPLIARIVADPLFKPRDTRKHYEYRLLSLPHVSEDTLHEFYELWKLMLLEAPY